MGYVKEPKDVDLVVGPSILTEDIKNRIAYAIEEYRRSGKKPVSTEFFTQGSVKVSTNIGGTRPTAAQADNAVRRKENV
jgi:hypothetical protein